MKQGNNVLLNNITLSDKLSIGVIAVAIILVMGLIMMGIISSEEETVHRVKANMERVSSNYETQLDRYLLNKVSMLQYMQSFPEIYKMNWEDQKNFLLERGKILGFHHIFIMDDKGYGYYPDTNEIKNQSGEEFYRDISSKYVFITEPYSEPEKLLTIITVCVAIYRDGQRVGTICGTIDLSDVQQMIAENETITEGKYVLINRAGEFLSGTDVKPQEVYDKASVFDVENDNCGKYQQNIVHECIEKKKNQFGTIIWDGQEQFVYITYLEDYNWVVAQYISKEAIFANVRQAYYWQIALITVIVLLTVAGFGIIRSYLKDNRRLCVDIMTGCNNRLACDSYLNQLENHYWESISIVFFDLNNFKYVNDVFGHDNGDALLKILAKSLEKSFGMRGTIFRLGGDEFISICVDRSEKEIKECWEQLNELLRQENKKLEFNYHISASYGYAIRHTGSYENLHSLMERADRAMFNFKENWKKEHGSYR